MGQTLKYLGKPKQRLLVNIRASWPNLKQQKTVLRNPLSLISQSVRPNPSYNRGVSHVISNLSYPPCLYVTASLANSADPTDSTSFLSDLLLFWIRTNNVCLDSYHEHEEGTEDSQLLGPVQLTM